MNELAEILQLLQRLRFLLGKTGIMTFDLSDTITQIENYVKEIRDTHSNT